MSKKDEARPQRFTIMRTHLSPDLRDKCPPSVDFLTVEPYEAQAQRNHGQTLQRLSERGGLAPDELVAVMEGRSWASRTMSGEDAVKRLLDLLNERGTLED